jgi:hypothetical protein
MSAPFFGNRLDGYWIVSELFWGGGGGGGGGGGYRIETIFFELSTFVCFWVQVRFKGR